MCGIAGLWTEQSEHAMQNVAEMIRIIQHRGPDAQGVLAADDTRQCVFGHARLAIVDLSPAGQQPMMSASSRYMLVFNGEIYNHQELRDRLQGEGAAPAWRGHSDTESLLAAIEAWGLERAISACVGMFAVALWDRQERRLTLVRDRFGEKPLYWAQTRRGIVFGSELKALLGSGMLDQPRLSTEAAAELLRFNNIPAPRTAFEGVFKLEPGCMMTFATPAAAPVSRPYWRAVDAWRDGKAAPFKGSTDEAIAEVERLLKQSIRGQMIADVPLGAFLSGGIDSSTVVALMQAQSAKPVRTFSIGFQEEAFNEADVAREVARRLGTQHEELVVTSQDAIDLIPRLGQVYCEPFADSSQIPTILVSRMARRHVTVALSGDAGDEVFGGYNRYIFGQRMKGKLERLPSFARHGLGRGIAALSPAAWDSVASAARPLLPRSLQFGDFGDKLSKLGRALSAQNDDDIYKGMVSQWTHPERVVRGARDTWSAPDWHALGLDGLDFVERMMLQDTLNYLPNDVLTKVDRASMSVALEARVPFLDHRLYELSASLPLDLKVRDGVNKWIVRELLGRHVPKELMNRPKTGFGIPLHAWLRTTLRDWAEALLSTQALNDVGVFDPVPVRKTWQAHLSGRENCQHQLWCVLMYQAWHQEWLGARQSPLKAAA